MFDNLCLKNIQESLMFSLILGPAAQSPLMFGGFGGAAASGGGLFGAAPAAGGFGQSAPTAAFLLGCGGTAVRLAS